MPYAANGPVQIYYETFGDPSSPPLLMINGLGSQCINYRVEWCEKFVAAGFFAVRFDNRDVGLSTKLDDHEPDFGAVVAALRDGREPDVAYRLVDMANDAMAVLDAVGMEAAHVMGTSMGGMIAQQVAIDHPERVLSLTSVMSTTGDPDVGQSTPEARAALMRPPAADRDAAIAADLAANRLFGSPDHFDADRLSAVAGEAFDRCHHPVGVARQMAAIMASGSRSAALGGVRVPTLVLHGSADTLVDPSGGRRTAESVPGARFELMEGMGHDYPPAFWARWVELVAANAGVSAG